jgi:hypothetical protein
MPSAARQALAGNLATVDDIIWFHQKQQVPGAGAPPNRDRSLVLGATALLYASWEGYVEQLAICAVEWLAPRIEPANVPAKVRATLDNGGATAWDFAGGGWRNVWLSAVREHAVGDGAATFGLNTAGPRQVTKLFEEYVGYHPFAQVSWQNANADTVRRRLAKLVRERGTIVHTAQGPQNYGIARYRNHRQFVERLADRFDDYAKEQLAQLGGADPW